MKHLGTVVSEFGGLGISDFGQHFGVANQPRVGGHDAVHIRPYPKLRGVQRIGENGGRKIAAAAAQRRRPPIRRRAIKAGQDRDDVGGEKRRKVYSGPLASQVEQGRGVAENGIGDNHPSGVHRGGRGAFAIEIRGQKQSGKPLSHRDRFIHRAGRTVTEKLHAFSDALKLGQDRFDLRQGLFIKTGGKQVLCRRLMTSPERGKVLADGLGVVILSVPKRIEQQVGHLAHGGDDDRGGAPPLLVSSELGRYADPVGGAHAGAAKFHDEERIQLVTAFPFEVRARTICRIASTTSSDGRLDVSRYTASGACTSGASARVRSRWSRALISLVMARSSPPTCSTRRAARTSAAASRKILTWASGNTCVAISRPSITTLNRAPIARCFSTSARLTPPTTET